MENDENATKTQLLPVNQAAPRSLGKGGFGEVTAETLEGLPVAVKRLHPHAPGGMAREELKERFVRETLTLIMLARLGHRNIIPIISADLVCDTPYFVMPRAAKSLQQLQDEGVNMGSTMTEEGPGEAFVRLARVFLQVLDGVEVAHQHGVVHRDLKPHNVLLFPDMKGYTACVADFGICRNEANEQITGPDYAMGSAAYMAPEQFESAATVTEAADIFSLGVMLYKLITGEHPGMGEDRRLESLETIASRPSTNRLTEVGWGLIRRCLEPEPSARFASIAELREAFWESLETLIENQSPLGPDDRYYLAREFGLYYLLKDAPADEANLLAGELGLQLQEEPRGFMHDFPSLHPRDVKLLVLRCPDTFADLLGGFVKLTSSQSFAHLMADNIGRFYRRVIRHDHDNRFYRLVLNQLLDLAWRHQRNNVAEMFCDIVEDWKDDVARRQIGQQVRADGENTEKFAWLDKAMTKPGQISA